MPKIKPKNWQNLASFVLTFARCNVEPKTIKRWLSITSDEAQDQNHLGVEAPAGTVTSDI